MDQLKLPHTKLVKNIMLLSLFPIIGNYVLYMAFILPMSMNAQVTIATKTTDDTCFITCTFVMGKKDFLYKDFIRFSVDNPDVILSPWHTTTEPHRYYDPLFKNTKDVFTKAVSISLSATADKKFYGNAAIYVSYYQKSEKKIITIKYPLSFIAQQHSTISEHLDASSPSSIIPISKKPETRLVTSYINSLSHIFFYFHYSLFSLMHIILMTLCSFIMGLLCIKKGTQLSWNYLRTLCNMLGFLLLVCTVFLCFKIMHYIWP